jgi:hypothetical protein
VPEHALSSCRIEVDETSTLSSKKRRTLSAGNGYFRGLEPPPTKFGQVRIISALIGMRQPSSDGGEPALHGGKWLEHLSLCSWIRPPATPISPNCRLLFARRSRRAVHGMLNHLAFSSSPKKQGSPLNTAVVPHTCVDVLYPQDIIAHTGSSIYNRTRKISVEDVLWKEWKKHVIRMTFEKKNFSMWFTLAWNNHHFGIPTSLLRGLLELTCIFQLPASVVTALRKI